MIDLFCHSSCAHLLKFLSLESPSFIVLFILHYLAPLSFWRYYHVFLILINTLLLVCVYTFSFQEKILWFIITFYLFLLIFLKWLVLKLLIRFRGIPLFFKFYFYILILILILFRNLLVIAIILVIIVRFLLLAVFNAKFMRWHILNELSIWSVPSLKLDFVLLRVLNHRLRPVFDQGLLFDWLLNGIRIWGV